MSIPVPQAYPVPPSTPVPLSTPVPHEYPGIPMSTPVPHEYPIIQAVDRALLRHAFVGTPSEASKARTRQASKARTGVAAGDAVGAGRVAAGTVRK